MARGIAVAVSVRRDLRGQWPARMVANEATHASGRLKFLRTARGATVIAPRRWLNPFNPHQTRRPSINKQPQPSRPFPQSTQVSDSLHIFELHIGTAFNNDVVLDASEAKVHISNILRVITKHAHDRGPKRLNRKIYLSRSNLSAKS
jgi:hypothetical protein